MPDFKANMHQIRFRLGLHHRPRWGANSTPPDSLAGLRDPTSKGRSGEGGVMRVCAGPVTRTNYDIKCFIKL